MPPTRSDLDPLEVFRLMIQVGHRHRVSRMLGFAGSTLTLSAHRAAKEGSFALLFALEAGMYIHQLQRTRKLAGLAE